MSEQFDDDEFVDGEEIQQETDVKQEQQVEQNDSNQQNQQEQQNKDEQKKQEQYQNQQEQENLQEQENQQKVINHYEDFSDEEEIQIIDEPQDQVDSQMNKNEDNQIKLENKEDDNQIKLENQEQDNQIKLENQEVENNNIDINQDDEFTEGEEIQIKEDQEQENNNINQKEQNNNINQDQQNDEVHQEEKQIVEQNNDEDEFVSGEEIQIQEEDDEFQEGEIVEQEQIKSNDITSLTQTSNEQIKNIFNELCLQQQCRLERHYELDSVPALEFQQIEINLDKTSVNYLLEKELQQNKETNGLQTPSKQLILENGVSQELKNAFLEQIKLYTLVWTKYQPYIKMSDKYNFVIEYPTFEYVDLSSEKSPNVNRQLASFQSFHFQDTIRTGVQEILDLIPDYSKLLETTFTNGC